MRRLGTMPLRLSVFLIGAIVALGTAVPIASGAPPTTTASRYAAPSGSAHPTPGSRGSVNVRELAKHPSTSNRTTTTLNLPGPNRSAGQNSRPAAPTGVVVPEPIQATNTANPPAGKTGFIGLTTTSGPATNGEPPDPYVAVGPDHVIQTTNVSLRVTDRSGGNAVAVPLFNFFGLTGGFQNTDPRVHYDSVHGRWLVSEISWICQANDGHAYGFFDLVVSRTADPYGTWDLWYWGYQAGLPDFGALGWSSDKLAYAANVFHMPEGFGSDCLEQSGNGYWYPDIEVFDWADLLANGGPNHLLDTTHLPGPPQFFTPRIALQTPATLPTLQVVVQYAPGAADPLRPYYMAISGSAVAHTAAIFHQTDLTVDGIAGEWVEPPPPEQPPNDLVTPGVVTDAIDSRPTDVISKGNRLIFVSTHGCTPDGDATLQDCVRVTELNTSGVNATTAPTFTQDFLVAENGRDLYHGGIGLALNGTLHVVWTGSSEAIGDYPSSESAYQLASDAAGAISPTETLAPGGAAYSGIRWGDYVGVAQDPQVPNAVWQGNQYSSDDTFWSTFVSQLQTGGSTYTPITPRRVLDTRPGIGIGLGGAFAHGVPRSWAVATVGPIPANAVAVTGNLTVTNQTAAGYVSVTPAPNSNPSSSTINFPLGDTRANNLTIPINTDGKVSAVYRASAGKTAHLIFDVTGYFLPGGGRNEYKTITPVRALDTRPGINIGLTGAFQKDTPRHLSIGPEHVPAEAVAISGNLTVVGQTGAGYLSLTKTAVVNPATSNLNFPLGDTRANGFVAPLDPAGDLFIVYKTTAPAPRSAHVILDVTGYFVNDPTGMRYFPLTPGRIMDTRNVPLSGLNGLFTSGSPRRLATGGHWGVPEGAGAITGNLTVVGQTAAGFVSVTLANEPNPTTSNLNFPVGDVRANGITVPANGSTDIWIVYKTSVAGKKTNLILDVSGYFD